MVAFVTGSTLGLSGSSLAVIGANGVVGDAQTGSAGERVYVNVATGDLVVQRQDEFVESQEFGQALSVLRTYNSYGQATDGTKDGWQMSVVKTISGYTPPSNINSFAPPATIYRNDGDGTQFVFTNYDSATKTYTCKSGAGAFDTLTLVGTTWVWRNGTTGATETYDVQTQRMVSSADREGNRTYYAYDDAERLNRYILRIMTGPRYANGYYYNYENWNENSVAKIEVRRLAPGNVIDPNGPKGDTLNSYDANGFLVQASTSNADGSSTLRQLVNDAAGRILTKTESVTRIAPSPLGYTAVAAGTHITHTLIANGEQIGSSSDVGSPDASTFAQNYIPVNDRSMTAGPSGYTVQTGDTLQSIAKAIWGDANLWFAIAEANGFTSLTAGQVITIPSRPTVEFNDFQTFKPYDAGGILGDTTATLPAPQAKSKSNWFKQLITIVVAVVAAVYGMGYLALQGYLGANAAAVATFAAGGSTGLAAAGAAGTALIGAGGTVGLVAGATAGAIGSVASQATSIALGEQHGFSWKQVALGAISGGAAGGLLGGVDLGPGQFGNVVARAAVANTITQGVGVVTGLQKSFNWQAVAASAVGSGVGSVVGEAAGLSSKGFGDLPFGDQVARRLITGVAAGTAAAVIRGGRLAMQQQVATDAFGNALGLGIVDASSSGSPLTTGNFARADHAAYDGPQPIGQSDDDIQSKRLRDALYGWNTENDGLGFRPIAGVGTVGMRYQGVRSTMFDDTRIFSDSIDPNALVNVGQDGSPTAQVAPIFNPAAAGANGVGAVGGGYQVVRPRGAGGAPGYDIVKDMPTGAPGYMQTPSLGFGAPPKQADGRSWLDFSNPGSPIQELGGLIDSLIFRSPSAILGRNLEAAGYQRPADSAAHHMVPEGDERADALRQRLRNLGIDINSAENGVFLPQKPGSTAPGAYHPSLNSDDYYRQLNRDFRGINSRSDAVEVLSDIRRQLLNGTYPGSKPVPKQ